MKMNFKKYGIMVVAAVLLVSLAFAGAAGAESVDIGTVEQWNAFAADTANYSKDINLTANLDFSSVDGAITPLRKEEGYAGNITGNGHMLSNFVIDGTSRGLIDYYSKSGDGKITDLILRNFSVSSADTDSAGGLVGYADTPILCENVKVEYGDVVSTSDRHVGGLIGEAYSDCFLEGCRVDHMYLSGNCNVGGLIGYVHSTNNSSCTDCSVVVSEIVSNGESWESIGGLVGWAGDCLSINDTCVKDCVIGRLSNGCVGGIAGFTGETSLGTFNGVSVENCSIAGTQCVGGLVGSAGSSVFSNNVSWVKYTWVNATEEYSSIGSIFGTSNGVESVIGQPLHQDVYNGTANACHYVGEGFDNSFNGSVPMIDIGSIIVRQSMKRGPNGDYGYGSAPSVTYTPNGATSGDVPTDSNSPYLIGSTVTVLGNIGSSALAKTGYTFSGWYNESTGPVVEDDVFTITKNVVLYANWTANTTTVYFHTDVMSESKLNTYGQPTNFTDLPTEAGYTYIWNVSSTGLPLTDSTYVSDGKWNYTGVNGGTLDVFENCTLNTAEVIATENKAEFGNDNVTALHSQDTVSRVLLLEVSNVTNTTVTFTADNTSVHIPSLAGYDEEEIAVFEINATAIGTATFNVTVTFEDRATATAKKGNVRFFHYNASGWEQLNSTMVQNGKWVFYTVETTSFSPFGIGIYTEIPTPKPSSNKDLGSTIILTEPVTPVPTATPTATAVPTIATVKPTQQQTSQSPAPVFGLIAGLGAAAVLLRLRK